MSLLPTGLVFTSVLIAAPCVFVACSSPAVVTRADQALLNPTPTTTSTSAPPIASVSRPPLLVAASSPRDLPPFSCPPEQTVTILNTTFCVVAEARNWHDAEANCQEHGGHLAILKTSAQSDALRTLMTSPAGVERFWIGLAEPSEGRWLWSNGTPAQFFVWGNGEPNNFGGRDENCGNWETKDGRWNDADCFQRMHFLCEGKTPPAGSRAKGIHCPGKRFTIGQNDYCLQGPATWQIAQQTCFKDGGELAMIDSQAENDALFRALGAKMEGGNLWIGLSDEANEGAFRWISGEPLDVPLWRGGEPNNVSNEDCVEWMPQDGLWNDVACSAQRSSLCEKPAGPAIAK